LKYSKLSKVVTLLTVSICRGYMGTKRYIPRSFCVWLPHRPTKPVGSFNICNWLLLLAGHRMKFNSLGRIWRTAHPFVQRDITWADYTTAHGGVKETWENVG